MSSEFGFDLPQKGVRHQEERWREGEEDEDKHCWNGIGEVVHSKILQVALQEGHGLVYHTTLSIYWELRYNLERCQSVLSIRENQKCRYSMYDGIFMKWNLFAYLFDDFVSYDGFNINHSLVQYQYEESKEKESE